jgi:hypothetical protein
MPTVTYNGQSFAIDNRRFWILGASIDYTRVPAGQWAARIHAARQAGFNTIETACPWSMHEPRRDRFTMEGQTDVRQFITLCAKAGMRVILRPGPYIGSGYDGGGLPAWLTHADGIALRESNELLLERINIYFRKLLGQLEDLQATKGGPILLVQSEHAWLCSNSDQAEKYLREITRVIRESGFTVPTTNANDLWQESPGTIDTWRGRDELLSNLRQLRVVQPDAPRLLSAFDAADRSYWGGGTSPTLEPQQLVYQLAQCLAAGAQPVVSPFHAGSNFGFLGGRDAGATDRFATTAGALAAPLGEGGLRGDRYNAMKRIVSFANHFSSLFAELDPDHHPIALDLPPVTPKSGRRRKSEVDSSASVVSLRGSQGSVIFVMTDEPGREVELLLDSGIRMPVVLGDQRVGWYVIDADINGSGTIDYANVCPYAIVGKSIVVFQGPEGAAAYLSINGTPLHGKIPTGDKPMVVNHKGVTVVICNQRQIDATYHDSKTLYVGVDGLDDAPGGTGLPIPSAAFKTSWAIGADGEMHKLVDDMLAPSPPSRRRIIKLDDWAASSAAMYVRGESPRYATLDGPCTLESCGAPTGYGWYAIRVRSSKAGKKLCHLPQAADRVHLAVDGEPLGVIGVGPGAMDVPMELRLGKGDHVITALVDNLGRFADGNQLDETKGLFGHLYAVKPIRTAKPKPIQTNAVNPFALRSYIAHRSKGDLSDTQQVCWNFTHNKKSPIIIDIASTTISGTLLLNDEPLVYFPGETGSTTMRLLISKDGNESFKRGKNELRFAPDAHQDNAVDNISKALALYEAVETLSEQASWSFAKWEPPIATSFEQPGKSDMKNIRGMPCWWRATFTGPRAATTPMWLDTIGMSKGQAFINGHNLGRYFTATATGKAVGPQTRLYVPDQWIHAGDTNEIMLFDEHGFDASKVRIVLDAKGDLDG